MTWFVAHYVCLDEEFDAPDIAADHHLCRAIAAGKWGPHPDGWGNHDPLTTWPPHSRRPYREPVGWPSERQRLPAFWSEPKPKPKPKPRPPPAWYPPPQAWSYHNGGFINLTCDECGRNFGRTLRYPPGMRPSYVVLIRARGRDEGWTCIVGRDRCPACSQFAPPQAKSDGAGTDQGDEQHG